MKGDNESKIDNVQCKLGLLGNESTGLALVQEVFKSRK